MGGRVGGFGFLAMGNGRACLGVDRNAPGEKESLRSREGAWQSFAGIIPPWLKRDKKRWPLSFSSCYEDEIPGSMDFILFFI